MYKIIKKIMKEYDDIQPSNEEVEEVKGQEETIIILSQEQMIFILGKLKSFVDQVSEVYKNYNSQIDEKVKEYSRKLDKISNFINNAKNKSEDKKNKLFSLISEIWITHITGIFEICNTALLMDIYYSLLKVDEPLNVFSQINWDFAKKDFKKKIKILAPYWAWLWLMTKATSDKRMKNTIYRGIGFKADRKYIKGKNYRFGNFKK